MHEYSEKGTIRLRDMEEVKEEKVEVEFDQTHYIHVWNSQTINIIFHFKSFIRSLEFHKMCFDHVQAPLQTLPDEGARYGLLLWRRS